MTVEALAVGVEAAGRVTLELFTILGAYADSITLVGGSTPPLLVGEQGEDPYVGTLDVDVLIDPLMMPAESYSAIGEELQKRGYARGPRPFQWLRLVDMRGQRVEVRVDLLAVPTAARGRQHDHENVEPDVVARRLVGSEIIRENFEERTISGRMPDGRRNRAHVRVAGSASFVVLKALAIAGRDKTKDSYDVDYVLAHIEGGPDRVAAELAGLPDTEAVAKAVTTLREKFGDVDAYGPTSVASHRGLDPESNEGVSVAAIAYARVTRLLLTYDGLRASKSSTESQ